MARAGALLVLALPVSAGIIPASQPSAADRALEPSLFVTALVAAPVSGGELPSTGSDLVLREEERSEGTGFFALTDETDPLELFMDRPEFASGNGGHGLRRFILLALLFGAILRYLTSTAFGKWAADVFDPLGGY